MPGWVRTRRFVYAGTGTGEGEGEKVPKMLNITEWTSAEGLGSEEMKKASGTEWRARVVKELSFIELRVLKVVKVLQK